MSRSQTFGGRPIWYVLDGDRNPVPATAVQAGELMCDLGKRTVAINHVGDVRVSTVFLCLDHGLMGDQPLLFETMIFGGEHDGWCDRRSTWAEAEQAHADAVALVERLR